MDIARNIQNPFRKDTLIYSFVGMCGNSTEDELNRNFEVHLDKPPFLDTLRVHTKGTLYCTGDSLYASLDTLFKDKPECGYPLDCFLRGKVLLYVSCRLNDNRSVDVIENYRLDDKYQLITKTYTYENGEWISSITEWISDESARLKKR